MCQSCGCSAELSRVEQVEETSRALRGTIAEELAQETPTFDCFHVNILKFHAVYQERSTAEAAPA